MLKNSTMIWILGIALVVGAIAGFDEIFFRGIVAAYLTVWTMERIYGKDTTG